MECPQCLELIDNLIIADPTEAEHAALIEHIRECPECALQYDLAKEALAAINPSITLQVSADFKERIMQAISSQQIVQPRPVAVEFRNTRAIKFTAIVAAAIALLFVLVPLFRSGFQQINNKGFSAFGLLAEASAAEAKLFTGNSIVHLVNEIVVKPVADPELSKMRWIPLVSLDATGKPRYNQLTLPAVVNEGYTIEDNSWFDPATGRFARIMTKGGKVIFASSFDGANVYSLDIPATGTPRLDKQPIAKDFKAPNSPAELLGIAAGLPSGLDVKDQSLVHDAGEVTLEDGSKCHAVKVTFAQGSSNNSDNADNNYFKYTIREDSNTIEQMEWIADGKSLLIIRRGKVENTPDSKPNWELAGIAAQAGGSDVHSGPAIRTDMVVPNVSVENMVQKADFSAYIFDKNPAWAENCVITDILDIVSPPHRMFMIICKAKDKRHVVLVQAPSYNKMLGPKVKAMGKLIYTSPSGTKLWDLKEKSAWLANILLQSARGGGLKDPPVKEPTGYLLETPDGTFPALAINGKLSDEELHGLIDSLVPAKK